MERSILDIIHLNKRVFFPSYFCSKLNLKGKFAKIFYLKGVRLLNKLIEFSKVASDMLHTSNKNSVSELSAPEKIKIFNMFKDYGLHSSFNKDIDGTVSTYKTSDQTSVTFMSAGTPEDFEDKIDSMEVIIQGDIKGFKDDEDLKRIIALYDHQPQA